MSAPEQTRDQALAKVLPLLCRSAPVATTLRAADGGEITPEMRDALLKKCAAGDYVAVDLSMLAYEQKAGRPNRNFVRFADKAMKRLGASGADTPFLKNHEQWLVEARGGTVFESATDATDGVFTVRQKTRLTAPWAVDMALRGLLDKVSIGWAPTGPIECSTCGTPIGTTCYHWPGDKVSESVGPDGGKVFLRDPNGKLTVEWVYTSADLIETSAVNVPGVPNAGIEDVRAALSAHFPAHGDGVIRPPEAAPLPHHPPAATQSAQNQEPTMPTTEEMAAEIEKLKALNASAEARAAVLEAEKAATLASLDGEVEKRTAEREKRIAEARKLATEVALSADGVEEIAKLAAIEKDTAKINKAILDTKVKEQKLEAINAANPAATAHVTQGLSAPQKLALVAKHGMLCQMSGREPKDTIENGLRIGAHDIGYFSKLSLVDIGMELLEAQGINHRALRQLGRLQRVKVLMGAERMPGLQTLAAGGMGSSDLSGLIGSVFGARLQQLYKEQPDEWTRIAKEVNLDDFTEVPIYALSNFPPLDDVPEGDPMTRGAVKPSSYNVKLGKGGRILSLTWEMMVNDRLGALDRIINDRFQAVKRWERRKFVAALIAGKIGTSATNFFASSGIVNIAPTTGIVSITTMISAFKTMAAIRGIPGNAGEDDVLGDRLGLMPKGLIAAPSDAIAAMQLLEPGDSRDPAIISPTAASSRAVSSMKALAKNIVTEPDLEDQATPFCVFFADPNECAAVQYGHLTEQPGPFVQEQDGFEVTGKDYAVVDPFYVVLADPRGAVKVTRS